MCEIQKRDQIHSHTQSWFQVRWAQWAQTFDEARASYNQNKFEIEKVFLKHETEDEFWEIFLIDFLMAFLNCLGDCWDCFLPPTTNKPKMYKYGLVYYNRAFLDNCLPDLIRNRNPKLQNKKKAKTTSKTIPCTQKNKIGCFCQRTYRTRFTYTQKSVKESKTKKNQKQWKWGKTALTFFCQTTPRISSFSTVGLSC